MLKVHILYPDMNERTFHTQPQFLEESIQKLLGGPVELWDAGPKHDNVLAVHESQMGLHNRLAQARYGVQARGPVALISREVAIEHLNDYI